MIWLVMIQRLVKNGQETWRTKKSWLLTLDCGLGNILSSIEPATSPVLGGEFGPDPDLAVCFAEEIEDVARVRVEAVEVDCYELLGTA